MFGFGAASGHADSICQLQRRLRLSDVGLQHSPAAQMLLEDASTIKVTTFIIPHNASMCWQSSVPCGVSALPAWSCKCIGLYSHCTEQLMTQIMDQGNSMKRCCLSVSAMQVQCRHACPAQMQHERISSCSMFCITNAVKHVCISLYCGLIFLI